MSRRIKHTHAGLAALALLAAVGLRSPVPAVAEGLTELGPAPVVVFTDDFAGRISAVACSRQDPDRYYAAAADGGVWRTDDGGLSWVPLTDHMPTTAMGAIAVDPLDDDVVYAGTGEANYANHSRYGLGLFKSVDGGLTWEQIAEDTFGGRTFSKLIVDPQSPQVLFAAIAQAGGFPELAAAKGHPDATGPRGVYRSVDGGATWQQLLNGLPDLEASDVAIDPSNPNIVYAAIGRIFGDADNGIYKSTDGGDSWTKLGGGLPSGTLGRISIAVAPSMPDRIYTLITNPATSSGGSASTRGAWRSDNGGTSWTSIPVPSIQATYGWYLSVVTVDPSNANNVIMGGLDLVRSTNAGANWSFVTPPHVDMHGADWDASGRLVIGDDGGVHRTANLGSDWTALNDGLGTIQFYAGLSTHPTDDLVVMGGTQDNGTNRRNSATVIWDQQFGGDGGWTQIDQVSPARRFAEFQGTGNLYRSTNGGGNYVWIGSDISSFDRNAFLPPYLIDPTNPDRMIYGTHRVWQSNDGGSNWGVLSGDLTTGSGAIRTLAVAPSDPDYVYAATNDGNVLVSMDGGASFDVIRTDNPGWPRTTREIFVDPGDPETAYLAVAYFGVDQVLRTRDAGETWEALDGNLPDLPVNVVAADTRWPSTELYAGTDAGLYRSLNDGVSWQRFPDGMPNVPVIDLLLETQRERLIVGTQGRGAWELSLLVPGDLDDDGDVDLADLSTLLGGYGCTDGDCPGDIDGDGDTDLGDLSTLLSNFGRRAS